MREIEAIIPDWKQQIESARFYDSRKDDIRTGTQFTVYTTPGIDLVLKVPKDPVWMQGYWLIEELAPEFAIPFARLQGSIKLSINQRIITVPEAVVQLKVPDLLTVIGALARTKKPIDMDIDKLIRQQAETARRLFQKGIFVQDPTYTNYGIDRDGAVRRFDFGDARISLTGEEEYTRLTRSRAASHYFNVLFLETFEFRKLAKWYADFVGLPPTHPRAHTLNQIASSLELPTWDPEVADFFGRIGHEEFQRFAPNGAPFTLNEKFLRSSKFS